MRCCLSIKSRTVGCLFRVLLCLGPPQMPLVARQWIGRLKEESSPQLNEQLQLFQSFAIAPPDAFFFDCFCEIGKPKKQISPVRNGSREEKRSGERLKNKKIRMNRHRKATHTQVHMHIHKCTCTHKQT